LFTNSQLTFVVKFVHIRNQNGWPHGTEDLGNVKQHGNCGLCGRNLSLRQATAAGYSVGQTLGERVSTLLCLLTSWLVSLFVYSLQKKSVPCCVENFNEED